MQTETKKTADMHSGEKVQRKFLDDLEEMDIDPERIIAYAGRGFYFGFAVIVDLDDWYDEQDIIRGTSCHLKSDNMGLGMVLYPTRSLRDCEHMYALADELGIEQ